MSKLSNQTTVKRIAVVEESAENIYSMRFILQSLGYQVDSVQPTSGFEEKIREFGPAVVMVDMLMPGRTGLQALEQLRSSDLDVRILAVTADAVPYSEEEMLKAGANGVLAKPYTVGEMQEKIESTHLGD